MNRRSDTRAPTSQTCGQNTTIKRRGEDFFKTGIWGKGMDGRKSSLAEAKIIRAQRPNSPTG